MDQSTAQDFWHAVAGFVGIIMFLYALRAKGSNYTTYTINDSNGHPQIYRVDYATGVTVSTDFCGSWNKPPQYICSETAGNVPTSRKSDTPRWLVLPIDLGASARC
jgi:hypothetical protein